MFLGEHTSSSTESLPPFCRLCFAGVPTILQCECLLTKASSSTSCSSRLNVTPDRQFWGSDSASIARSFAMGTSSKSASHHLLWDKARNRVDDLQEMFAVLEEQVHRRLRACWAELNQPSPATSLQLREEEDDAASKLAFGNTPKPEQVELQQADVGAAQGGRAANFLEAYYANRNVVGQKLLYAGYYESNLHTRPDNVTCLEGVNHYNY
ncbi:hypothetical protein BHM03_00055518 [Ensete ventricosum]|nr:hypothetical protein BHM03_00055518 [Ensete ventricosum]